MTDYKGIEISTVDTYNANIFVGTKDSGISYISSDIYDYCQRYCNEVRLCVNVKMTQFVYVGGQETGFEIGLINYPRFPKSKQEIQKLALDLAIELKALYNQKRVSVVFSDKTIMLGENDHGKGTKGSDTERM